MASPAVAAADVMVDAKLLAVMRVQEEKKRSRPLERPVNGATADTERLGDLGHGDIAGLIPGPGERDLLAR